MFKVKCILHHCNKDIMNKLFSIGFRVKDIFEDNNYDNNITICNKDSFYKMNSDNRIISKLHKKRYIDCGDDEELFFILCKLRNDTDKNYPFILKEYDSDKQNYENIIFCETDKWPYNKLYKKASIKEIISYIRNKKNILNNS